MRKRLASSVGAITLIAALATIGVAPAASASRCGTAPRPGVDWHGCDKHGANLAKANLSKANLSGANLTSAILWDLMSGGIIGTPIALPAPWRLVNGYLVGPNAILTNANLAGVDLSGAVFYFCDPHFGICVGGANLTNADLTGANLSGATLTNSQVSGATWSNTICPDGTRSDTNGTTPQSCTGHGGGL